MKVFSCEKSKTCEVSGNNLQLTACRWLYLSLGCKHTLKQTAIYSHITGSLSPTWACMLLYNTSEFGMFTHANHRLWAKKQKVLHLASIATVCVDCTAKLVETFAQPCSLPTNTQPPAISQQFHASLHLTAPCSASLNLQRLWSLISATLNVKFKVTRNTQLCCNSILAIPSALHLIPVWQPRRAKSILFGA